MKSTHSARRTDAAIQILFVFLSEGGHIDFDFHLQKLQSMKLHGKNMLPYIQPLLIIVLNCLSWAIGSWPEEV